jgi:hypothetical protein
MNWKNQEGQKYDNRHIFDSSIDYLNNRLHEIRKARGAAKRPISERKGY